MAAEVLVDSGQELVLTSAFGHRQQRLLVQSFTLLLKTVWIEISSD